MQIEITRFHPYNNDDSPHLRGFCNFAVHYGENSVEVPDCRYYEKGDQAWIKLPTQKYVKRDTGEEGHRRIIIFDRETFDAIQTQGVAEIRKKLNPQPQAPRAKVEYSADDEIPF